MYEHIELEKYERLINSRINIHEDMGIWCAFLHRGKRFTHTVYVSPDFLRSMAE